MLGGQLQGISDTSGDARFLVAGSLGMVHLGRAEGPFCVVEDRRRRRRDPGERNRACFGVPSSEVSNGDK